MEKLFMSASIVVAIVLCVIGIIKLPFKKMKNNHPKTYKAIFTLFSVLIATGLCVLDEMYILCGELLSLDFAILVCAVMAGVFGGYNGVYEGLGLKELVKKIIENVKKARDIAVSKKAIKYLNKIENVEEAISFLEERKNKQESEV